MSDFGGGGGGGDRIEIDVVLNTAQAEQQLQQLITKFKAQGLQVRKAIQDATAGTGGGNKGILPDVQPDLKKIDQLKKGLKEVADGPAQAKSGGNFLKSIAEGLNGVDDKLKESGLSIRSFSVLLGAGLASGVAGVVRILDRVIGKLADFAGAEEELGRQTRLSFGDATGDITQFAETTAGSLGASRDEALRAGNTFAALAKQLQLPDDAAKSFAETLVSASAVFANTEAGFKGTEDAAKAVEAAITGDTKALAQLGITSRQFAAAAREDFGKLPDQLTPAERAFIVTGLAAKQAGNDILETGVKAKSTKQNIIDTLKAIFFSPGQGTPTKELRADIEFITSHPIQEAASGFKDMAQALHLIKDGNIPLDELKALRESLGSQEQTGQVRALEKAIDAEIKTRQHLSGQLDNSIDKRRAESEVIKANIEAFKESNQQQQEAVTLIQGLNRAVVDGNERVTAAQQNLQRANEDNAKRARDVAKRNSDAIIDADRRVDDAERNLTRARQDRAYRDQQAAENTAKTILDAQRANRTAAENLQDFERDSARRVADLQERIRQLQHQSTQGLFDVQVQIINARLTGQNALANAGAQQLAQFLREQNTGNSELADARRDLQREQEDDAIKLFRLKRDQQETEKDGIDKIKKAQEEQSHAALEGLRAEQDAEEALTVARENRTRAIRDAADAVRDLNTENTRAIQDANKALADAQKERDRAVADASRALENFVKDTGVALDVIVQLLQGMGLLDQNTLNFINQFMASQAAQAISFGLTGPAGFMAGGRLDAGQPAIVNEIGPELFIPDSSGTVITAADFRRLLDLLQRQAPSHGVQVVVNEVSQDPVLTAWKVGREVMKAL